MRDEKGVMDVKYLLILTFFLTTLSITNSSDITSAVFGQFRSGMPAAFGDFNSDELTDVFVLSTDQKTVEILLASNQEPLLQRKNLTCSFKNKVTSVVPGDFDGDVYMDMLVTTRSNELTDVFIFWGQGNNITNCTIDAKPLFQMQGQPLTIDYDQNMIIDLFGVSANGTRAFWVFDNSREPPKMITMDPYDKSDLARIRQPHSHAYLDLNHDFLPDLMLTTENHYEIWYAQPKGGFRFHEKIELPFKLPASQVGQSLYLDIALQGQLEHVVPVCFNRDCSNSSIAMFLDGQWYNLELYAVDKNGVSWGFVPPTESYLYTDAITLRSGDFNMDGYPDVVATLHSKTSSQSMRCFQLENSECTSNCHGVNRTFKVSWDGLDPFTSQSVMAVFYDFYQDGIMDVILVQYDKQKNLYQTAAFKSSLDYDANFVKVMVITGLVNKNDTLSSGSLGKKKRTYGTNLPGPLIWYNTTSVDGTESTGMAGQLMQSAHFSLNLPFTTFGLGRTSNFIETLTVGMANRSREWRQIIPNSQMVVIPNPIDDPARWKVRLFVTPSKLILLSAAALTATCGLISAIIVALYWKERREDKNERQREAHRFHFDAM